jgi:hypothetical protein
VQQLYRDYQKHFEIRSNERKAARNGGEGVSDCRGDFGPDYPRILSHGSMQFAGIFPGHGAHVFQSDTSGFSRSADLFDDIEKWDDALIGRGRNLRQVPCDNAPNDEYVVATDKNSRCDYKKY